MAAAIRDIIIIIPLRFERTLLSIYKCERPFRRGLEGWEMEAYKQCQGFGTRESGCHAIQGELRSGVELVRRKRHGGIGDGEGLSK